MELTGEYRIAASRERVWEALNDPDILRASIPGCSALEAVGADSFVATVTAKVGPVKTKFQGQVTLSDLDPPNGYTITGEGKGGPAGFAKGGAKVRLEADGADTLLRYEVEAKVGGKLAQIGSRLIDGAAKKLAGEFFENFSALAAAPAAEPANGAAASEPAPPPVSEPSPEPKPDLKQAPAAEPVAPAADGGMPMWVWICGLIAVVAVILFFLSGD